MEMRTPFYEIKLEAQDITSWVTSVTVVEDDTQADSVALSIPDPTMVYADALFEGSIVEIDMGYAAPNEHALVLRAMVTKLETTYPESGMPTLTVKGEDRSILMGLVEKKKVWQDGTVTGIVQQIGSSHGFAKVHAELSPDPTTDKPIHQDGKTDLAFLQELAKRYHAKCFVELDASGQEVLYFLPERRIVELLRPDEIHLRYRAGSESNLVSFSPSFDTTYIDRLKKTADVDAQGNIITTADKPPAAAAVWNLDPARVSVLNERDRARIAGLFSTGGARRTALQQKVAAQKPTVGEVATRQADLDATNDTLKSRSEGMTSAGSIAGNVWLRAKSTVLVSGVGDRWNGRWYASSVTHKIDTSGFKTDFKLVR